MARAVIRAIPLYIDGKKVAEVSEGEYDLKSGDEAQIATDGYIGHSDGAMTVSIAPTCIVPVVGMGTAVEDALFAKKYVTAGLLVNGKFHQVDCRVVGVGYSWDWKSGKCTGKFSLEGGVPTRV